MRFIDRNVKEAKSANSVGVNCVLPCSAVMRLSRLIVLALTPVLSAINCKCSSIFCTKASVGDEYSGPTI